MLVVVVGKVYLVIIAGKGCPGRLLRVIVMLVRSFIIIVAVSMVVVVKLMYLRTGPVINLVGLVLLDTMPILARTYVKSWNTTLHFNAKLLSVSVLV